MNSNYKAPLNLTIILSVIAFGLLVFSGSSLIFDFKFANSSFLIINERLYFIMGIGLTLFYFSFLKFKKNELKSSELFFFFGGIAFFTHIISYFSNGFAHSAVYVNNPGLKDLFSFIVMSVVVTLFQSFSYFLFYKLSLNMKED